MNVTEVAVIDELAGAAELVMRKTTRIPVVVIRGFKYKDTNLGTYSLFRNKHTDMFR